MTANGEANSAKFAEIRGRAEAAVADGDHPQMARDVLALVEVADAAEWLLSAAVVQHGGDCRDTSGRVDCVCGLARLVEALKPFVKVDSGGHGG